METINTHDAKTRLSQLLDRVIRGEEFIIARAGKPVARLVGLQSEARNRKGGAWKGLVRVGEDFDDPLPAEVSRAFGETTGSSPARRSKKKPTPRKRRP